MRRFDVLVSDRSPDAPHELLIHNVRVFDGTRVIPADSVLVRDGVIADVGSGLRPESRTHRVDGAGCTLLPGLIDAHVHAMHIENLSQALAFGVTTELDIFCVPPHLQQLRDAAATRADVADFRSAGIGATAPGGHPTQLVSWGVYPPFPTLSGPDEAEQFVAARVAEGVDYVKIFVEDGSFWGQTRQTLSPESVQALTAAAHAHGKLVLVHADGGSVRMALDAGVDALAHHPNDADAEGDVTERLSARGRFVIPTIKVVAGFAPGRRGSEGGNDDLLNHPQLGPYLDHRTRQMMRAAPPAPPADAPAEFTKVGLDLPGVLGITARLHQAGIALLAGSDAIPVFGHGIGLHRELELLAEAGLSPAEALTAATATPADRFALTDRGRIAPGLRADLLLVAGDPTSDITATRNITAIWRSGIRFDREAYREAAATARAAARPSTNS